LEAVKVPPQPVLGDAWDSVPEAGVAAEALAAGRSAARRAMNIRRGRPWGI
jgi:hypothetical protein